MSVKNEPLWKLGPNYAGCVRTLERVQDSLKEQADDLALDGAVDDVAWLNIGRLDAVIEALGGRPSEERWS